MGGSQAIGGHSLPLTGPLDCLRAVNSCLLQWGFGGVPRTAQGAFDPWSCHYQCSPPPFFCLCLNFEDNES